MQLGLSCAGHPSHHYRHLLGYQRKHAALSCPGSTIATLRFMAHRSGKTCSESRLTQLGLCSRRRGVPVPRRRYTSYIGCQFSSGSHTSWQFWNTKFRTRLLWVTWATESHRTCLQLNSTFISHHLDTGSAVHQYRLLQTCFQTCFPVFGTVCLELAATYSDSVCFQIET